MIPVRQAVSAWMSAALSDARLPQGAEGGPHCAVLLPVFGPQGQILAASNNLACAPVRFFMSGTSDHVAADKNRYFLVLGVAAADLWSDLPQELQQSLFERAVVLGHKSERDESLREQLAKFLHDHHARTQHV